MQTIIFQEEILHVDRIYTLLFSMHCKKNQTQTVKLIKKQNDCQHHKKKNG